MHKMRVGLSLLAIVLRSAAALSSTKVLSVIGIPPGWAISFWNDHNRTPRSRPDFMAPNA
jgi:hypothetical protein